MHNAEEFLTFVAANERRLKHNLRKNITYDEYLFEEAYQNAIIKVYNSIVKNDKIIEDFEQYFFIASKFEYILLDNRNKKARNVSVDVSEAKCVVDDEPPEEYNEEVSIILNQLTQYLENEYGRTNAHIFLDYFAGKSKGKISYKSISTKYGLKIKHITDIISAISEDTNISKFHKAYQTLSTEYE